MIIRLSKGSGKSDTLVCIREDGSSTWAAIQKGFGAHHDLIHFVVETTLGYKNAFYGLLAQGRDIDSFGTKNGKKDAPLPLEAGFAENIVGLLQPERWGTVALPHGEFCAMLKLACGDLQAVPHITPEQLGKMRAEMAICLDRWDQLTDGESIEIVFAF